MFNSLKGIVTGKTADHLYLETSGIEWALESSATTLSQIASPGQEAKVFTYLHHREDSMLMFGFATMAERELFLNLISVSGVGPKAARKILSGISVDAFIDALEAEDVKTLTRLPGLGTKTAQKIILQLRGKLIQIEEEPTKEGSPSANNEWVTALVAMGFDKKRSVKTISSLEKEESLNALPKEKKEQEIMRRAIVELSS